MKNLFLLLAFLTTASAYAYEVKFLEEETRTIYHIQEFHFATPDESLPIHTPPMAKTTAVSFKSAALCTENALRMAEIVFANTTGLDLTQNKRPSQVSLVKGFNTNNSQIEVFVFALENNLGDLRIVYNIDNELCKIEDIRTNWN